MRKVYVIGVGTGSDAMTTARRLLADTPDVELICVNSMEDVPLEERMKSVNDSIMQIHTIKPQHIFEDLKLIETYHKKRKGHERPYKYHR